MTATDADLRKTPRAWSRPLHRDATGRTENSFQPSHGNPVTRGTARKTSPEHPVISSRTCKPNSVCRIAPAGRSFLWATHCCAAQATYPEVVTRRAGTYRNRSPELPPYLVLLRVGFALPIPLLGRRCALTAPFHPYPGVAAQAVYFLWYFPSTGLEPSLPDVIRHTALRSSDFPPAFRRATVRSGCQRFSLYSMRLHCAESWFSLRFVRHHGTSCRAVAYIYRVGRAGERSGARGSARSKLDGSARHADVGHILLGLLRMTLGFAQPLGTAPLGRGVRFRPDKLKP